MPEKKKGHFVFIRVSEKTKDFVRAGGSKAGSIKKYFLGLLKKDGYDLDASDL